MAKAAQRTRPRTSGKATRRGRRSPWPLVAVLSAVVVVVGALAVWQLSGSEGQLPVTGGDVHSLTAEPGGSGRVWVGGHQAVAVSEDGGASWQAVDSLEDADAMGWAFVGDVVLVGGHPGIRHSVDGGPFEPFNDGLPVTDIHALGGGGGVVYAASPGAGLLVSIDQGASWRVVSGRAGQAFMGRIVVDPSDPAHLRATDMRAGVVESRDGGRNWRSLGGAAAMWLSAAPDEVGHLVASGPRGVVESRDGGATWSRMDVPEGVSLVEFDGSDASVLYAAKHEAPRVRVWISRDGGASWQPPAPPAG